MPKAVRKYNTSNLTYGGRTLRVKANMPNMDQVTTDLMKVVQNFDRGIRNEVMNDAIVYTLKRAKHYIQEGKKEAQTPNPADNTSFMEQRLSQFVQWDETDVAIIDLSAIPYASLHNAPLGTSTLIGEGQRMVFYWYRKHRWVSTYAGVKKPGRAFLTRALKDVAREMPKLLKKYISVYREAGSVEIAPLTGARLRGPARSPTARRNARL
jgi:hypothetical protein